MQMNPDKCRCGGPANFGQGDLRCLMNCQSCGERWLVLSCRCGNLIDFRVQQYCSVDNPLCDLKPYNVCLYGTKAIAGTDSIEGVMFCRDRYCSCHSSRWAYHVCDNCSTPVDYRYAAMCECKECIQSRQYYRICPTCGKCPSEKTKPNKKNIQLASKPFSRQQALNI